MMRNLALTSACCIVTSLCACSTQQIDLTENTTADHHTTIIEERWSWGAPYIKGIDGTALPFSRTGKRIDTDPGTHQLAINCWNGLERLPFSIEVHTVEDHHYLVRCKSEIDLFEEQWWVVVVDKNKSEEVSRSQVTVIPNQRIDMC